MNVKNPRTNGQIRPFTIIAALIFTAAACSAPTTTPDDGGSVVPDGGVVVVVTDGGHITPDGGHETPDAGPADGGDAPADGGDVTPDAGPEDGGTVIPDGGHELSGVPAVLPLSPTGSEGLMGVAYAADGQSFYATGFIADGTDNTSDRSYLLAKFNAEGVLDTTFGTEGFVRQNVAPGGKNGEGARGIVVQSTGRIVIAGAIEHNVAATGTAASDRDIALAGFLPSGALDTTFGTNGIALLDLNTGVETTNASGTATWAGADTVWALRVLPDDKLVVHGSTRAAGFQADGTTPRTDTDFALVKVSANGAIDPSFGTNGVFTLDVEGVNASPREISVLADGSIVAAGYANPPSLASSNNQAILYKVSATGVLDTSFGNHNGVFYSRLLTTQAEAYGAFVQGDKFVTTGYGKENSADLLNWVSLRFTSTGQLDPTWGTNGAGMTQVDFGFNDNSRNVVVLPDNRVLLMGGGAAASGVSDAALALLDQDGRFDTSFAPNARKTFDLGGPTDFFWAGALSPDQKRIAIVGLKGAGSTGLSATNNDDSAVYVMPIPKAAPVPAVVPASSTGSEALMGVAWQADGSGFYATGFSAPGTDNTSDRSYLLARFHPNGVLDSTFGTGGFVTLNVAPNGKNGEGARGIVVQSSGRIVVAGAIEHDVLATGTAASDRDIALAGFLPNGMVDPTFGTNGIALLDLNTGVETTNASGTATWAGADTVWSLRKTSNDSLLVHGSTRAEGFQADGTTPRTDTDFALVKLTPNGAYDTTFGTDGVFTLDVEGVNASPREISVLADGSIVAAGYANPPSLSSANNQAILYKVSANGVLNTTFGNHNGVFYSRILTTQAEAYGAFVQGNKLVTTGYGKENSADLLDWVSLRFTEDGQLDTTWGTNGVTTIDFGFNDNSRNVVVLPDNRVLLMGGGAAASGVSDAALALLTENGQPDQAFALNGRKRYDLGGPTDFFWAGALSPDQRRIAFVGLKGMGTTGLSATNNDDCAVYVMFTPSKAP